MQRYAPLAPQYFYVNSDQTDFSTWQSIPDDQCYPPPEDIIWKWKSDTWTQFIYLMKFSLFLVLASLISGFLKTPQLFSPNPLSPLHIVWKCSYFQLGMHWYRYWHWVLSQYCAHLYSQQFTNATHRYHFIALGYCRDILVPGELKNSRFYGLHPARKMHSWCNSNIGYKAGPGPS